MIPAFVGVIITEVMIVCCRRLARKSPANYIILLIFTLCFSFIVACITLPYNPAVCLQAGIATALTTIALTHYAWTTTCDMTMRGGALHILIVALSIIVLSFSVFSPASFASPLLCGLVVILYGFFLIHDMNEIAGKNHHKLSIDDYVLGAMLIYIDIIYIFIYIL